MKLSMLDEHRSPLFRYHDSSLQPHIMQQFSSCRRDNRFIDLEVEVEGVVFPCHQILLDAFCPYFSAYFSFHERKSGEEGGRVKGVERVSLEYNGVSLKGFSKLLDFMYSAELEVTTEDVIDVLRCADFLQFHQVVHLCSAFLQQHITTDTCLQVLVLAQAHGLFDLAEKALRFILSNITEIMFLREFTQVSKEVLVSIISSPHLELETEATVVEAVLLWVKGCEHQRQPLLQELLQYARLRHIDLKQIEKRDICLRSSEIVEQVKVGEKALHEESTLDSLSVSTLPDRLTEVLVVVSRETERKYRGTHKDRRTLYYYDPESICWEALTEIPFEGREGYSAMVVKNTLYLTGGQSLDINDIYCNKIVFNDNWAFNPLEDTWEERQSMMVPRYNHSAATMLDKLYVVGGRASSSYSLRGDGEVYDPSMNQWTIIASVRCISGIGNAALTSLNGKLYILGGTYYNPDRRTSVPYETYQGAQVYNPQENLWQELLSLEREVTRRNLRLSSGGVVALEGFLLLLDDDIGKSHQLYNPVSQTLTDLMQAHGHHWFAGWAMYQGQLVCTGGLEDGRIGMTDLVHCWDLTCSEKGWRMMPSLPHPMSHHACMNMYLDLPRPGAASFNPEPCD